MISIPRVLQSIIALVWPWRSITLELTSGWTRTWLGPGRWAYEQWWAGKRVQYLEYDHRLTSQEERRLVGVLLGSRWDLYKEYKGRTYYFPLKKENNHGS